jgi:S1-C subfamily serine protease
MSQSAGQAGACRLARALWFALWLPVVALAQQWGLKVVDAAAGDGVEVSVVATESPAARAGLRTGDRVLGVQGRPTRSAADVAAQVQSLAPGAALQLRISRDGWERSVALEPQAARGPGWLGASVADAAAAGRGRGAVVGAVAEGGPAARAGLKPGDVLIAANGRELRSAEDLNNTIAGTKQGDRL